MLSEGKLVCCILEIHWISSKGFWSNWCFFFLFTCWQNTLRNPFVQVFIKLMVDLDAAELLAQINKLGKLVRMCCLLIGTSGLQSHQAVAILWYSFSLASIRCCGVRQSQLWFKNVVSYWKRPLESQSACLKRCFLWMLGGIVGWESLQLSVATGGHCLAIIMTSNELPGTLLGNVESSLASRKGST